MTEERRGTFDSGPLELPSNNMTRFSVLKTEKPSDENTLSKGRAKDMIFSAGNVLHFMTWRADVSAGLGPPRPSRQGY